MKVRDKISFHDLNLYTETGFVTTKIYDKDDFVFNDISSETVWPNLMKTCLGCSFNEALPSLFKEFYSMQNSLKRK